MEVKFNCVGEAFTPGGKGYNAGTLVPLVLQ
jgi:hypothetical protein